MGASSLSLPANQTHCNKYPATHNAPNEFIEYTPQNVLIALRCLILFFYFYLSVFIAALSPGGHDLLIGLFYIFITLFLDLIGVPLLTAGGMSLVNWSLQDLSDSKSTRAVACMHVALSALLTLLPWLAAIVLPNGLWVEYLNVACLVNHCETNRIYRFLPITAVPRIGLLFTTYSGHVLLMQRKPRSFAWLVTNHAPFL